MLNHILITVGRLSKKTLIPEPWGKIIWFITLIFLAIPVLALFIVGGSFLYSFIWDHLLPGPRIDFVGFSVLPLLTLLILFIHYAFSKNRSLGRTIRWACALIFIESVVCIWFNAWRWEVLLYSDDSFYALPKINQLEAECGLAFVYLKALFKIVVITSVLLVLRLYFGQKHNS